MTKVKYTVFNVKTEKPSQTSYFVHIFTLVFRSVLNVHSYIIAFSSVTEEKNIKYKYIMRLKSQTKQLFISHGVQLRVWSVSVWNVVYGVPSFGNCPFLPVNLAAGEEPQPSLHDLLGTFGGDVPESQVISGY